MYHFTLLNDNEHVTYTVLGLQQVLNSEKEWSSFQLLEYSFNSISSVKCSISELHNTCVNVK